MFLKEILKRVQNDKKHMITALIGKKIDQSQAFLEDGTRVPVTHIMVAGNTVILVKNKDKYGYDAIQLGFGIKKNSSKAEAGQVRGAKLEKAPQILKEVRVLDSSDVLEKGTIVKASEVFKPGDVIDVAGFSKGKGYAGVVKRHHFRGGPKTHGQSDRERAPGSIGQTTTPGRVYKGKRMAGRMGSENVTIKNLNILEVSDESILIKGLIPGIRGGFVVIEKVGEVKSFVPIWQEKVDKVDEVEKVDVQSQQETPTEVQPQETPAEQVQEQTEAVEEQPAVQAEQKESAFTEVSADKGGEENAS